MIQPWLLGRRRSVVGGRGVVCTPVGRDDCKLDIVDVYHVAHEVLRRRPPSLSTGGAATVVVVVVDAVTGVVAAAG